MKYSFPAFFLLFCFSCSDQLIQTNSQNEFIKTAESTSIMFPSLIGSAKPNAFYTSYQLTYTQNRFIGIGNLNDKTFTVNSEAHYSYENNLSEDWEQRNDKYLKVYIDTSQVLTIDEYQLPENFHESLSLDDYFGNNFQKILDQYPVNKYKSLPVFIVNESTSYNTIWIEDGQLAMIYEAIDQTGTWKPIEFKTYSWCGNSYSDFNLEKNQFALFKVPEQTGDFITKLRLKARIGERIFYSNEISGTVNLTQFNLKPEEGSPYDWHYVLDPENSASLFLDE